MSPKPIVGIDIAPVSDELSVMAGHWLAAGANTRALPLLLRHQMCPGRYISGPLD